MFLSFCVPAPYLYVEYAGLLEGLGQILKQDEGVGFIALRVPICQVSQPLVSPFLLDDKPGGGGQGECAVEMGEEGLEEGAIFGWLLLEHFSVEG